MKRLYGWLYFLYLRLRWRWLRSVSAGEYVSAVARYYMRERNDQKRGAGTGASGSARPADDE